MALLNFYRQFGLRRLNQNDCDLRWAREKVFDLTQIENHPMAKLTLGQVLFGDRHTEHYDGVRYHKCVPNCVPLEWSESEPTTPVVSRPSTPQAPAPIDVTPNRREIEARTQSLMTLPPRELHSEEELTDEDVETFVNVSFSRTRGRIFCPMGDCNKRYITKRRFLQHLASAHGVT